MRNVWYMIDDVINYEYDDEGNILDTDNGGAREAGVDVSGIITLWLATLTNRSFMRERQ